MYVCLSVSLQVRSWHVNPWTIPSRCMDVKIDSKKCARRSSKVSRYIMMILQPSASSSSTSSFPSATSPTISATGHTTAGFACQIAFSANGKFIASGDGEGKLHFWDWKSTKVYCKYRAHENGPCIGTIWHPIEPSWVATCGWDGVIKLWD